ncbi:hypothetical protein PC9H_008791 [Pleurotus ostreatus]|uniref:F-box domain-containing protein n=1 Tax=Pleurotus ostreatus TaxID=5322 RepID=A0A8H7DRY8_PLEOS|nr:uncharacterized protein PC9H_008791 [Pleurotus ostreatus]KAF7426423.1 hypothetical protein PC9H_008791 [Pleurotus ostreatus]
MFVFGSESAKVRLQPSFTLLDVTNTHWGALSQTHKTGKRSPSAPSTWARKRVQLSPELLRGVFEHFNNADNARNARVCRNWRDGALALVWRCVDLGDTLRLLAPLVKNKKGGFYKFSRNVSVQDWERFDVYAKRVQQLTAHPKKQYDLSPWRSKVISTSFPSSFTMGSSSYPSSLKRSPPPKIFTAPQDLAASLDVAIEMIKSLGHLQSLRLPLQ